MNTDKALRAVRYASGTTGVNFEKWLTWGVLAGGAWLAYKVYSGLAKAGDAASKTVADAYVRATAGPVIEVLGRVVLPNGLKVPLNDVAVKSDFTFMYGQQRYKLTKRRPDNDYDSVKV
jgi:hypothetical protein